MMKQLNKFSFLQIFLLASFLIGSLVILFFLINFFFWFIILGLAISKSLSLFKNWQSKKNNFQNSKSGDFIEAEYEHIEK